MNWYKKIAQETPSPIDSFIEKWRDMGISTSIFHNSGDDIMLNEIVVPKAERGGGVGTQFMNELTQLADSLNRRITLTPDGSYGATSVNRLKRFYKRFGFVENKGRNKDFTIRELMYRNPQ